MKLRREEKQAAEGFFCFCFLLLKKYIGITVNMHAICFKQFLFFLINMNDFLVHADTCTHANEAMQTVSKPVFE